jgi:hypothetical protein
MAYRTKSTMHRVSISTFQLLRKNHKTGVNYLGVALEVLQERQEVLDALLGPAGLSRAELLTLGGAANAGGEAAEGDRALVLKHVLKVALRLLDRHALDGLRGLVRVLTKKKYPIVENICEQSTRNTQQPTETDNNKTTDAMQALERHNNNRRISLICSP